jgi:hypothetical protein
MKKTHFAAYRRRLKPPLSMPHHNELLQLLNQVDALLARLDARRSSIEHEIAKADTGNFDSPEQRSRTLAPLKLALINLKFNRENVDPFRIEILTELVDERPISEAKVKRLKFHYETFVKHFGNESQPSDL